MQITCTMRDLHISILLYILTLGTNAVEVTDDIFADGSYELLESPPARPHDLR